MWWDRDDNHLENAKGKAAFKALCIDALRVELQWRFIVQLLRVGREMLSQMLQRTGLTW